MTDITRRSSPAPQVDGFSAQHSDYLSNGLQAGLVLTKGDACYLDANGRVQKAVSTVIGITGSHLAESKFDGLVNENYTSGTYGVSLYGAGAIVGYGSGMTVGKFLYVSSNAGNLADAMPSAVDRPVAKVISATDILILR